METALTTSQLIVRVCLFLFLIYLLALGVLMAGLGRLLSISKVGMPAPIGCGSAISSRSWCFPS